MKHLTPDEIRVLVGLVDAGVRSSGLRLFTQGSGVLLQSALQKLDAMAQAPDEDQKAREALPEPDDLA